MAPRIVSFATRLRIALLRHATVKLLRDIRPIHSSPEHETALNRCLHGNRHSNIRKTKEFWMVQQAPRQPLVDFRKSCGHSGPSQRRVGSKDCKKWRELGRTTRLPRVNPRVSKRSPKVSGWSASWTMIPVTSIRRRRLCTLRKPFWPEGVNEVCGSEIAEVSAGLTVTTSESARWVSSTSCAITNFVRAAITACIRDQQAWRKRQPLIHAEANKLKKLIHSSA
jgi:hypothetical protein